MAEEPSPKRQRSGNAWLRAWAWKREHRPDKVRFDRPYLHPFAPPGSSGGEGAKLTIHQQRFKEQGFASTVWDSSIVLAKYFEKHAARFAGRRCLDLSAGCGLPGVVLAKLGAQVTATDLAPNLPLLQKNAAANGCDIQVVEHSWGSAASALGPPFDVVCACDVMYISELVGPLVASLVALSGPDTDLFIAHGRNRQAEPDFLAAAAKHFDISTIGSEELDDVYQCVDVDVLRLRLKQPSTPAAAAAAHEAAAAAADDCGGAITGAKTASSSGSALGNDAPQPPAALPRPALALRLSQGLLLGQRGQPQSQQWGAVPLGAAGMGLTAGGAGFGLAAGGGSGGFSLHLPPRAPDWPPCSPEKPRRPSEDATSPRGPQIHALAGELREAAASGGRLTKAAQGVLLLTSGGVAGAGASINPALSTRNRKTELDLEEPPPPVAALVRELEGLQEALAASECRSALLAEAWSSLLARALTGELPPGTSALAHLTSRALRSPAYAGAALAGAREALRAAVARADGVLGGLGGRDAAAQAVLEAMQRFATRATLPLYVGNAGLYLLPWLERGVWQQVPSLAAVGLAGAGGAAGGSGAAVAAAARHLAAAHEALEDAVGGAPEEARQAACRAVLAAAGAAVLGGHMRGGEAEEHLALRCLEPLGPAAAAVRCHADAALQVLAPLRAHPHKLAAAAEVMERGARLMRLAGGGWAAAMWAVLRSLQL